MGSIPSVSIIFDVLEFSIRYLTENKSSFLNNHILGTLESGEEFDCSRKRGAPIEFKLGVGQVIKGWDQGMVSSGLRSFEF